MKLFDLYPNFFDHLRKLIRKVNPILLIAVWDLPFTKLFPYF